jgi:hypothetical protein
MSSQFQSSVSHSFPTLPYSLPTFQFLSHPPLTLISGEIHCHDLYPLGQWVDTGPLYCLTAVRKWYPVKSHSEYNCFKWSAKGFLAIMCSYGHISSGMFTRSLLTAWITDLTSSAKCSLNAQAVPFSQQYFWCPVPDNL